MTMAAHRVSPVDPFALARAELENVFKQLAEAGASHHVTLGKLVTEGMERVGALTFQDTSTRSSPRSSGRYRGGRDRKARKSENGRDTWRRTSGG